MENLRLEQANETKSAQTVVNHLSKEIENLQKMNRTIVRQWEESLAAMVKRDSVLQKLEKNHEESK